MFLTVTLSLFEGLAVTIKLFALTLVFALPLGLIISFGSMSKLKVLRYPVKTLVWIVRGSPLMIQLLIVYYGLPIVFGIPPLPRFPAALIAFVFNYACYFSEIYRGGIEAIPKGQYEAGQVLGMTKNQIFFKVAPHVQRDHHPGQGHVPCPYYRCVRADLERPDLHQERRYHLAFVLHHRVLPGVQRRPDPAVRLHREKT